MIRSNDLEKRVRLGKVFWDLRSDEDMLYLGDLSSNLKVYCDYIKGHANNDLNVYVVSSYNQKGKSKFDIAMEVYLCRTSSLYGMPTYSVGLVGVDDRYKGFNLAPKVYAYLLKKFPGWILRCGASQSSGGRSIWNSLCKQRGVSVFATTPKNKDYYLCKYGEDGEIQSDVDLYTSKSPYYLYAVKT